jgi:hypothetical protein
MFRNILILGAFVVLGGCAYTQEAVYVDHEFGMAQNDAFDQQIAYKNYQYADSKPVAMPGIHAEKIMDTYQNSFDKTSDSDTKNFSRGYTDTDTSD